ncbi:hypothetical protein [Brevibacillus brevis]|uniref:hypothetical protein n=1 Tax=Brevibacillus brevis TaxID=1393 RepID=UPI001EE24B42|nr:hypothetical protein [Brevibacillus brevis]
MRNGFVESDQFCPGGQCYRLNRGSAYGLDAASGAMRYMEEQGQGYNVGVGVLLLIPAEVIFNLSIGGAKHKRVVNRLEKTHLPRNNN